MKQVNIWLDHLHRFPANRPQTLADDGVEHCECHNQPVTPAGQCPVAVEAANAEHQRRIEQ